MNILVTGANGYLGGKLCEALASSSDHYIRALTRRINKNSSDKVEQIICNWNEDDSLKKFCKDIDVIVHLAALNADDCLKDPVSAININIQNTARLIEAAKKENIKRFIYISTAHVYGNPMQGIINENSIPRPRSLYAITHRTAEEIVNYGDSLGEYEGICLRLSNAYGAPADVNVNCWGLLFNDLCKQAVENKVMKLKSNGIQKRDFITITDAVNAIKFICEYQFGQNEPRLFNIGGDWTPTIWEATNLIADRYEYRTGIRPNIIREVPPKEFEEIEYRYQNNLINSIGFKKNKKRIDEIDELIIFCEKYFNGK